MRTICKYLWLPVFLGCMAPVQGQLIRVTSRVSNDSIMIGDQLKYTVSVDAADNVSFQMPAIGDTLSGQLEVLSPVSADTTRKEGRVVIDHTYLITGFESGNQMIPSIPVAYRHSGTVDTARSMPVMIRVTEPEVDLSGKIKDIKPPINAPLTLKELLPWIALGVGIWLVGTLIAALVWIFVQRRRNPEIFSMKPRDPAHVEAFKELDALKEQKLWESGRVKEFYTRLTEITRNYIERQYGIPAMERTTDEILDAFRISNTDDPLLDDMLRELLQLADLVKFAKEDPLPVDNQTNLNNAYLFVQKTYPLFFIKKAEDMEEEEPGSDQEEVNELPEKTGKEEVNEPY